MSKVKRLNFTVSQFESVVPYASEHGQYVRYTDYAKLAAEAQALREEVAALRARVVVVPERITPFPENIDKLDPVRCGWNACLDELARINGMTVSESALDTLRRFATGNVKHMNNGLCPDDIEGHEVRDPDCPVCRALIETGKESDNV